MPTIFKQAQSSFKVSAALPYKAPYAKLSKQSGVSNAKTNLEKGIEANANGDYSEAENLLEPVYGYYKDQGYMVGSLSKWSESAYFLGTNHLARQQLTQARELLREASALARISRDTYLEITALIHLGFTEENMGNFQTAINYFVTAKEQLERIMQTEAISGPYKKFHAQALLHIAQCDLALKTNYAEALDLLANAKKIFAELKDRMGVAQTQLDSGRVHVALGQTTNARRELKRANELFRSLNCQEKCLEVKEELRTMPSPLPRHRLFPPAASVLILQYAEKKLSSSPRMSY
jgi:tetratricopeptide (TPR) repeat protein